MKWLDISTLAESFLKAKKALEKDSIVSKLYSVINFLLANIIISIIENLSLNVSAHECNHSKTLVHMLGS